MPLTKLVGIQGLYGGNHKVLLKDIKTKLIKWEAYIFLYQT